MRCVQSDIPEYFQMQYPYFIIRKSIVNLELILFLNFIRFRFFSSFKPAKYLRKLSSKKKEKQKSMPTLIDFVKYLMATLKLYIEITNELDHWIHCKSLKHFNYFINKMEYNFFVWQFDLNMTGGLRFKSINKYCRSIKEEEFEFLFCLHVC